MKNATEKLSKRNGDASYQDLVAKGYLPAAIVNYLALLGWAKGRTGNFYNGGTQKGVLRFRNQQISFYL